MTERYQLVAYLATLAALVAIAAVLSYSGRSVEAVGVAAAVTGLIKLPSRPSPATNVETAGTVLGGPQPPA